MRVQFQDGPGPGGCCARVRINLRLLVKIRALSFHLCVRARARARSLVRHRPTYASGPRLPLYEWDIYMRRRCGEKKRNPRRFSSEEKKKTGERESERDREKAEMEAVSRILFIFGRKRKSLERKNNLHTIYRVPILWQYVIFLTKTRREVPHSSFDKLDFVNSQIIRYRIFFSQKTLISTEISKSCDLS